MVAFQREKAYGVKVGEKAEGGGSVQFEGHEVFELELRLQRPSGEGQGGQERAALGRGTCTTQRDQG